MLPAYSQVREGGGGGGRTEQGKKLSQNRASAGVGTQPGARGNAGAGDISQSWSHPKTRKQRRVE